MCFELRVQDWRLCSMLASASKRLPFLLIDRSLGTAPVLPFYSLSGGCYIFVPRTNC
uniref:Uncharacterized protein n=1 Tax=Arundo donax TaxID=35708 RepID=A0A0A9F175_ARUDO